MALTDYQKRQAIKMHNAGISANRIARELGVSYPLVHALFATPQKPKPTATKSILGHRIPTSVIQKKRRLYPRLDHEPTHDELRAMLASAVRNTKER